MDKETALREAFDEYYKLASVPCTNPSKDDLAALNAATEKYMALLNSPDSPSFPTSAVYEDIHGVTRCGECDAEIVCNDTGDMPDICPACKRPLDYSSYGPH